MTSKRTLSVSVAGVVVDVDVEATVTVGDLIKKALATLFTPESCPEETTCGMALSVDELARDTRLEDLPLGDGVVLNLKLPF